MSGKRARMRRRDAREEKRIVEKLKGQGSKQSTTRVLSFVSGEEERYSQLRAILRKDQFGLRQAALDSIMRMMIENEINLDNEDYNHKRLELLLSFSEFIFERQKEAGDIIHNTLRIDVQKYPDSPKWWLLGYQRKS